MEMRNQPCMKSVQSESRENEGRSPHESVWSERGYSHRECAIWAKVVLIVREWERGSLSRKGECVGGEEWATASEV